MSIPVLALAVLFFLTALAYASVGFGGGSTYTALLVLTDTDYRLVPPLSLICNIIVVTGGVLHARRAGTLDLRNAGLIVLLSAPFAFLGGMIPVSEALFTGLLAAALLVAGLRLALARAPADTETPAARSTGKWLTALVIGAALGFLAGLVGIGGGIFLAPVLHFLLWDTPRRIAATCSLFILVNSLAGLAGQILKLNELGLTQSFLGYWPLAIAVLIGGNIGSFTGMNLFSDSWLRRLTALLILIVAIRLIFRYVSL